MVENTRLKELSRDIKQILQFMKSHHAEYSSRFESLETTLTSLHVATTSKSSTSEAVQPFQVRNVKLDFTRFNGSNELEWIFRTEQFFTFYNTPEE